MIEPVLITLAVAALGATGIRLMRGQDSLHDKVDKNSERLAKIEGRLSNGIQAELARVGDLRKSFDEFRNGDFADMKEAVDDHIEHEEQRIVDIYRRLTQGGGR